MATGKMTNNQLKSVADVLPEPLLEFRYGQQVTDPRDGLSLFGPYDADASSHPTSLSYGVVGTSKGIELFELWSEAMATAWTEAPHGNTRKWPPYPGFQAVFSSKWESKPIWTREIDGSTLSDISRRYDRYERVYSVVNEYLAALQDLSKLDERVDVMVCVVPEEIYRTCRTESTVSDFTGEVVSGQRIRQRRLGCVDISFQPDKGADKV